MATPARYFDLVREMKDAYNHRLRLVESAKRIGIKPTARLFTTTVPTVRKWLRRFQQRGPSGLLALSRARHQQAQKTAPLTEAQPVELRKTLPTFGSRRLIREFDLPISHRALERIWREHGLLQKRQKKYQRKQDLAHIKVSASISGTKVYKGPYCKRCLHNGWRSGISARRVERTKAQTPDSTRAPITM